VIYNLYKQRGETPLQCIERFKEVKIEGLEGDPSTGLRASKMTYLGRLDPMADGVLLVATDEDTKQSRKDEFLALDKDYDFTALFGFATDTYDCLGKILKQGEVGELSEIDLIKICKMYEGEREQKYPKYSSVMIAKRKAPSQTLPQRERASPGSPSLLERGGGEAELFKKITIYKMQFKGLEEQKPKERFGRLLMDIGRVKGDFRQTEILEGWKNKLFASDEKYYTARFTASVSSGTYIRSIVNDLGSTLGCGACALSIMRTRVGDYLLSDSFRF